MVNIDMMRWRLLEPMVSRRSGREHIIRKSISLLLHAMGFCKSWQRFPKQSVIIVGIRARYKNDLSSVGKLNSGLTSAGRKGYNLYNVA